MSDEVIRLERGERKKYEIMSILLHFYNNKYLLDDAYYNSSQEIFRFRKLQRFDVNNDYKDFPMPDCSIKVNHSSLKCAFTFNYKDRIYVEYGYDNLYNLANTILTYSSKSNTFRNEEIQVGFIRAQNKLVEKLSFFEKHYDYISQKLYSSDWNINSMYRFKPSIDRIYNYNPVEGYKQFVELATFAENEMKDGKRYDIKKFIKFTKRNRHLLISIGTIANKNVSLTTPDFNSFFDIFLPVFQHYGGLQELQNMILSQRLMEE